MSIIVRNNPSTGVGGSTPTGFPPGDVSNIIRTVNDSKILIKWTDPDDTIIDGITIAKWKGTILVRKKDSAPSNINDGDIVIDNTTRNKYKDNYYEDNNLEDGNYYYRFFTYSTTYIYNDDSNMIYNINIINIDPILKNNTWEQIVTASELDIIPSTWKIGDEIDITLKGTFNEPITLQIWDFKHFDKTDGTGKAGICFGMKHLMKDLQKMNSTNTNSGGWNECNIRKTVMNNIYNSMPINIRYHIKEVNTYANQGNSFSSQACTDKIFIPGFQELGWSGNYDGNQVRFPIFSYNNSRIKKSNNGSGNDSYWWTRSPIYISDLNFHSVGDDGDYYNSVASNSDYICFCFNI